DFSLLCIHAHEEIGYSIDGITPMAELFSKRTRGIVIGWSDLDSEHFPQTLLHDESVVNELGYERSDAFSIGAITPAPVLEIRRNPRFGRKIRNLLKRDSPYRPVVRLGFNLREDLNQGEPGGINWRLGLIPVASTLARIIQVQVAGLQFFMRRSEGGIKNDWNIQLLQFAVERWTDATPVQLALAAS